MDESWIARCRGQQASVLAALEGRIATGGLASTQLMQPEITVATALGHMRLRQPEMVPSGRYPALDTLCGGAEMHSAFKACLPTVAEIGGPPEEACAVVSRLQGM